MKTVLTIAGSDCSGGAGIQADLKTMTAHGVYGMSVITALTAQNTTGVQGILSIPGEFVAKQLDSVFSDIRPDAVKIGMMSNVEIIEAVAERLKHYEFTNIVLDPVMVSTSRHRLLEPSAEEALIRILLPMARILTPNLPEAMVLAHRDDITNREEMLEAAKVIATETGAAILVKHVLRNALIPIVTYISLAIPYLFTGSLLLESFFGIPGLGSVSINAIHSADMAVVRAVVVLGALLYQFVNLVTDLAYAALDPRVRFQNG
jgi:hydroxymethylpyrimidine kinase/phosphomethylpyrimidine kinase